MSLPPAQLYEFDQFKLDPVKRRLWRDGEPISLTPRVFETLLFLVQHHNILLDKERLMEAVWPDSIVEENNLTQNISTLRRVFGETPGTHRYIVTVPGRGYRFVANVRAHDATSHAPEETESSLTSPPSIDPVPSVPAARKAQPLSLLLALLLAGGLVAGVFAFKNGRSLPPNVARTDRPVALPTKSIAVLPFENLSTDPQNSYLAAGIQEEILSNLAKLSGLKVISRTSTKLYTTGNPRNAQEIGQQLGVAHLLEGSVQRSGEHLRVHAQLIDTKTDSHLWAQTYDRELADVFAIQSEIAQAIANQLQVKISEQERKSIQQPSTSDLIANDLYSRALVFEVQLPEYENQLKAIDLLEQAVARDPHFVQAYCAMSRIHLNIYLSGQDHTIARRDMANSAIEKAAVIQPDGGEVHLIRARYLGFGIRDYDGARRELDLARRTLPNNPAVYYQVGILDRRQGRWAESITNLERALELDPRNSGVLGENVATNLYMRRYREARKLIPRLRANSQDYWARLTGGFVELDENADPRPFRTQLDTIMAAEPDAALKIAGFLFDCAIYERDAEAADLALAAIPPQGISDSPELVVPREWFVGYAAQMFGLPDVARPAFEGARAILEKLVTEQPDRAPAWSLLGRVYASLGREEEAMKAGRKACELLPVSKEATSGFRTLTDLARIYTQLGKIDLAIEQLATLTKQPVGISYGDLKLNPIWDPLRGDSRFDQIVATLAQKADGDAKQRGR